MSHLGTRRLVALVLDAEEEKPPVYSLRDRAADA